MLLDRRAILIDLLQAPAATGGKKQKKKWSKGKGMSTLAIAHLDSIASNSHVFCRPKVNITDPPVQNYS